MGKMRVRGSSSCGCGPCGRLSKKVVAGSAQIEYLRSSLARLYIREFLNYIPHLHAQSTRSSLLQLAKNAAPHEQNERHRMEPPLDRSYGPGTLCRRPLTAVAFVRPISDAHEVFSDGLSTKTSGDLPQCPRIRPFFQTPLSVRKQFRRPHKRWTLCIM